MCSKENPSDISYSMQQKLVSCDLHHNFISSIPSNTNSPLTLQTDSYIVLAAQSKISERLLQDESYGHQELRLRG